ncbi:hypothetical protein Tco_0281826 [Tanacetum coccineum]
MMEMQRFLSASNVVVECFKLLKELQDDELEKSREMMLQSYVDDPVDFALAYSEKMDRDTLKFISLNICLQFQILETDIQEKDKKSSKNGQNRARNGKRELGPMSSESRVAWVTSSTGGYYIEELTLKDFLYFLRNRSASFSEMVVVAPVANNTVGAEVVPPSAGRHWWGVVARPVGSPRRVIAPSSDVDSKGKRVTFPNSADSPSFKKREHVVLDEGPSSPKSVPDIAPSDDACKTLFGSLASTEDPGDSDPFLPGIEEARSSRDAL